LVELVPPAAGMFAVTDNDTHPDLDTDRTGAGLP
jgi:hypothetical protein